MLVVLPPLALYREASMTDNQGQDLTTQILIQIRDEMRAMRSSFERRFDAGEARMEGIEARLEGIEARMEGIEGRLQAIEKRMDSLEKRIDSVEKRVTLVEQTLLRLESKVDALQVQMDFLQGRIDALEVQIDALDGRNEVRFEELFKRFNQIDADLKKFASVVNNAILHYAGEMDTVRERLQVTESKLGISYTPE